jgi:hypothetical protein
MPTRLWILPLLVALAALCAVPFGAGCSDQQEKLSEPVRKLHSCRRLIEDSTAVVLTLKKGMNDYELELLQKERSPGLQACLLQHPDLPGRCMDLTSRESIKRSMEVAITFCMTWPDELVDCLKRQDQDSPGCRQALEAFRGKDGP